MTRCNSTAPKTKKISAVKGEVDFKILAKGQDIIVLLLILTGAKPSERGVYKKPPTSPTMKCFKNFSGDNKNHQFYLSMLKTLLPNGQENLSEVRFARFLIRAKLTKFFTLV